MKKTLNLEKFNSTYSYAQWNMKNKIEIIIIKLPASSDLNANKQILPLTNISIN